MFDEMVNFTALRLRGASEGSLKYAGTSKREKKCARGAHTAVALPPPAHHFAHVPYLLLAPTINTP